MRNKTILVLVILSFALPVFGEVKVAVVRSWGKPDYPQLAIFAELNNNSGKYGDIQLKVDTSLHTVSSFTYADLVNTGADVLWLANPAGGVQQFSTSEIEAVRQYVSEGHSIIGTHNVFLHAYGSANQVDNRALAPIFGLQQNLIYTYKKIQYTGEGPSFQILIDSSLFYNISNPYVTNDFHPYALVPANDLSWDSDDLGLVSLQAQTSDSKGVITFFKTEAYHAIFVSEFVEHNANSADIQFIYNALTMPEPTTPPVANADGPYSIYVGDTLTLDANGSTDADDDIVSYMWDLDGDVNFETDAGGEAIFDVNFAELQSLGLLINYPYTIGLKVTDNEGQSDVNDTTLIILPKPAIKVAVDIKPGSCPNPVNVKSSGVLPIAILGTATADYDVTTIDPTSIRLAGVEPLRSGYEDVATPVSDSNDCNCTTGGPDGLLDLTLKFATQRIVEAIGDVNDGDVLTLELTGVLFDPMPFETPIEGADCILIRGRRKPFNKGDINKDGVVDNIDFAIIAENWLQSSIIED